MRVANSTATPGTTRRRHGVRGANALLSPPPHTSSSSRSTFHIPKPFRWYVDWVRANEENAQSLERLSRTFAIFVADPSDLINMEGVWTVTKMQTFVNQAIIQTGYQATTPTEVLTYILKAIQELEGLGELLTRKYCNQRTTWNALLALQSVKCVLNMCVHHHLFLMPWVWQSVRLYLRRVMRALWLPRYFIANSKKKASVTAAEAATDGPVNAVSNNVYGDTVGPNGTRLVIPRVVSNRRSEHRHYFNANANASNSENEVHNDEVDDEEEAWEKEVAGAVPFTFIDILSMAVDAFLLIRPVLVVAAARHVFPHDGAEGIAKIPDAQAASAKAKAASKTSEDTPTPEAKTPVTAEEKKAAAAAAERDHTRVLRATMEASSAQQTLFSSWRWWAVFAALDAFVVLISRFIRSHRIPVVYISEPSAAQALLTDDVGGATVEDVEEVVQQLEGGDGGEADGAVENAGREHGDLNTDNDVAVDIAVTNVPDIVSRDSLRLQQAMRNAGYTFLRDPFFTVVAKQFIYNHFVTGFVNKIPLFGSLIAFQVGYFLSMQHYSFLYTVGQ